MNRILSITASATCMGWRIARASPMGCKEDDHCPTGYYCEVHLLFCHKCLQCEALGRLPPPVGKVASCITSVTECGPCYQEFTADSRSNQCMPVGGSNEQLLLPYEWAVIGVALFLALLVCIAAVYILRNFNIFKIRASTSVRSAAENSLIEATAPQPPPPYTPISPNMEMLELRPFIKEISPPRDDAGDGCELARQQTARPFNNPSYVRTLHPLGDDSATLSPIQEDRTDAHNGNSATSEPGSLASSLQVQAQSGKPLYRQDSNNNTDEESEDAAGVPVNCNGPAIFINVINDANTVLQRMQL